MKPSHPSHRPWKSPKNGDYHIPTARQLRRYTDISIGLATLSFLMSSNIHRGASAAAEADRNLKLCFDDNAPQSLLDLFISYRSVK
jgi:hypothetical protein